MLALRSISADLLGLDEGQERVPEVCRVVELGEAGRQGFDVCEETRA